jgi:hypothetical protein
MARLTLARKIAAITLIVWKKEVPTRHAPRAEKILFILLLSKRTRRGGSFKNKKESTRHKGILIPGVGASTTRTNIYYGI